MALSNEQLLNFVKKNPVGVGCGLLCLALGAAIYFRGEKIPEARAVVDAKTTEADRLKANKDNSADLKDQYDELVADNKAIEARLVKVFNIQNPSYFYKLADEVGISNTNITPTQQTRQAQLKAATKGSFVYVDFTVSMSGSYTQILDFMRKLENGQHFCRVLNATFSPPGGENADLMSASLNLELLGQP